MEHETHAVRSVRIVMISNVLVIILQTGIMAALARLVTPVDYGLLAGSLAIMRVVQHFLTAGPERALLVLPDMGLPVLAAAFQALAWIGLGVGLLLAGAAILAMQAGWSPPLFLTLAALAPLVPLSTMGVVFRATLRRHLAFGRISLSDIAGQLIGGGIVAYVIAVQGGGVFALVAGQLVATLLQTTLCGFFALRAGYTRLTGAPAHRWQALKPLARSSATITSTSLLEVLNGQLPVTVIGMMLGGMPLGLYNRAIALVQVPVELIVTAVTKVRIGTISAQRENLVALREACCALVALIGAITLPLCAGMAAAASSLTLTILGPGWEAAVPVVAWTAAGIAVTMLGHVFGVINEGMLRFTDRFRIQLAAAIAHAVGLMAGGWLAGLTGGLAGAALAGLLFFALHVRLAATATGMSVASLLRPLWPGFAAAAACVAAVRVMTALLASQPAFLLLMAHILVCAVVTIGLYATCFPRLHNQLLRYAGLMPSCDE